MVKTCLTISLTTVSLVLAKQRAVTAEETVVKEIVKHETDDAKAYRFAVELPGFQKDEIHVDVKDGYLTVSAQKGLDKDEEDKKGRVLRQERYAGACSRSFYVGDVKAEDVKAKYESGVLTVLIPKKEPKKIVSGTSVIVE